MTYKQLFEMVLLTTVDIAVGDLTLTIQRVPKGWVFLYRIGVGATLRMVTQFVEERSLPVGSYKGPEKHG